jgi:DUF1680 family protein
LDRRKFLEGAAALPLAAASLKSFASGPNSGPAADASHSASDALAGASSDTPHRDRYQLSLTRVLSGTQPEFTHDFLLADIKGTPGRRFTNFSGDLSGRWIGALAASSATFGMAFPQLDTLVHDVIALQHPEGCFGSAFHLDNPNDDDLALLWGNGRLLVGLLEFNRLHADPAVLIAARRLGDFLVQIAPVFNSRKMAEAFGADHYASSYICWTQQTEGLAALFAATGDTRYRDLCAGIASRIERRAGDHVHGYLCSVRGTLDLYTATADHRYLDAAVAAWRDVVGSGDILITGGVPERWSPKKLRTEGCAEADWLRLNLSLYRATGEAVYLDTAMNLYFNDFSMNQFASGDFGHAVLNEQGTPGKVQVRAWWCCSLHGLRAFSDVHQSVFRVAGNDVHFEFPLDGAVNTEAFAAHSASRLARDGAIEIQIARARENQSFTVRKPVWGDVSVSHNGKAIAGLKIENVKAGDRIAARYTMQLRDVKAPGAAGTQAIVFGPWLLGAPSSNNPSYLSELQAENRITAGSSMASKGASTGSFRVPIAATTVGYIPAEFPEQPGRVELRAIAEQTAESPTEWQMVFRSSPAG